MNKTINLCLQKLLFLLLMFASTMVYSESQLFTKDKWYQILQKAMPAATCDYTSQTPLMQKIYTEFKLSKENCILLTNNNINKCFQELSYTLPPTFLVSEALINSYYHCVMKKIAEGFN